MLSILNNFLQRTVKKTASAKNGKTTKTTQLNHYKGNKFLSSLNRYNHPKHLNHSKSRHTSDTFNAFLKNNTYVHLNGLKPGTNR